MVDGRLSIDLDRMSVMIDCAAIVAHEILCGAQIVPCSRVLPIDLKRPIESYARQFRLVQLQLGNADTVSENSFFTAAQHSVLVIFQRIFGHAPGTEDVAGNLQVLRFRRGGIRKVWGNQLPVSRLMPLNAIELLVDLRGGDLEQGGRGSLSGADSGAYEQRNSQEGESEAEDIHRTTSNESSRTGNMILRKTASVKSTSLFECGWPNAEIADSGLLKDRMVRLVKPQTPAALPLDCWTEGSVEAMRAEALAAGFDLAGVSSCAAAEEAEGAVTAERFTSWIKEGNAGEMEYLKRTDASGDLLRRSARVALPWARSIIVCAMNYNANGPYSIDPVALEGRSEPQGWIARYAWNGDSRGNPVDYHDDLMLRLRQIEGWLRTRSSCETRCYVDTGPLLERDFAARAGIGWIGKNTCVLNQEFGSWLLLGVIVTSVPMAMTVQLAPDRCGTCTRCIDACPTAALVAPRNMDASLCIAYLTIEKKGSIAEELRAPMGRQVFGCDICQEVCPWNRRAPVAHKDGLEARGELVNPPLEWLAALDREGFKRLFAGSPLERTKPPRIQRNVAIAMGNSGDSRFRPQLERWSTGQDSVLAEASTWALRRLRDEREGSARIVESAAWGRADPRTDDDVVSEVARGAGQVERHS